MEISACPKCGSRRIFQGRLKEGVLTGYNTKYVCRDCGYQGFPLIFDSEEEYKKFLDQIPGKKEYEKRSEKIQNEDSERSFIVKNITVKLGLALIVTGLLITAATRGLYLSFMGVLIFDGIILFLFGIFASREHIQNIDRFKNYPKIAGRIMIVTGVIFLVIYILMVYLFLNLDSLPIDQSNVFVGSEAYFLNLSIVLSFLCVIEIFGGIFSILKKNWLIALIGAIIGTLVLIPFSTVFSLVALILLSFSKPIFSSNTP